MRLWPRSIRGRDTLAATLISAVLLGVMAVGAYSILITNLIDEQGKRAIRAATQVTGEVREGGPADPIAVEGPVSLVQVVGVGGVVLDASEDARGLPAFASLRPPPDDRVQTFEECAPGLGCVVVNAIRVTSAENSPVVYAAAPMPWLYGGHRMGWLIGGGWLILVAGTCFATWTIVGRTLRPIGAIRSQLAEYSISNLSRRVPVPRGRDEIAQLAGTANDTLDRLEHAVEQQRRFSSDASHELRTPIAGLRAQLESALMYPDDADLLQTVRGALRDTERLQEIVDDLLLLARLGTGTRETNERVDLGDLVAGEVANRHGDLVVGTDLRPGVVVYGVPMQLQRLLMNLLDNAARYGGGAVDLVVVAAHGQGVLMVTDRGPGIPEADRERVFQRFTRLDSARSRTAGGTGLGLAIARDIAVAHDGSLRVEDSGRGARFVLRLPLAGHH